MTEWPHKGAFPHQHGDARGLLERIEDQLRERIEDIQPLVFHFLERYKDKTGRFVSGISKEALRAMVNYDWSGNVRELENSIERAVIIASGRQIEPLGLSASAGQKNELPSQVSTSSHSSPPVAARHTVPLALAALAGHVAVDPVQNSSSSQTPPVVGARQDKVLGWN